MKKTNIYIELILTFIFFLVIALFYRGPGLEGNTDKILSVATFLFAINMGFSTANRKSRLNAIRSLLRKNDASILYLYESSKNIGKKVSAKVQKLLDDILIAQIDYNIIDFEESTPQLMALLNYVNNLQVDDKTKSYKDTMVKECEEMLSNQKDLIYQVKDKMMIFEWISLLSFGSIIIYCIYSLSDGSALTTIALPLAASAMALLMYIIRDINNLSWQEENWVWARIIELYQEIDLPPYLFSDLFTENRISKTTLSKVKKYRLVEYAHPYPDFTDKKVTLVGSR